MTSTTVSAAAFPSEPSPHRFAAEKLAGIFSGDGSQVAQCSHYCELVLQPEQMPRVLEIAMQTAISKRGVAVIALPGDVALRGAVEQAPRLHFSELKPRVRPSDEELNILAEVLNRSKAITILAGA